MTPDSLLRRRSGRVRLATAALAWGVALAIATTPVGGRSAIAAVQTGDDTPSAVTVSGTGEFAGLKVHVNQTQGLIDQDIHITWSGAKPTVSVFKADYLQIMQCWGDDSSGPTPRQCEYGNSADTRGGAEVPSRQLFADSTLVDPAESVKPTDADPYAYLPFHQVDGTDVAGDYRDLGEAFDSQSTNELPFNQTGVDGTGEAYFETQTAEESPGLGCGAAVQQPDGSSAPRNCWLVVVPRGESEVNGQPYSDFQSGLVTSPLSATNWAKRIMVPLKFAQVGISCPIGSPQEPATGQEVAQEAVARWQAQLCRQSGTVYAYARQSDDQARRQLRGSNPGLDFMTNPIAADAVPSGHSFVYAPVLVSGVAIAFNIDYSAFGADALRPRAGQRVPEINLTPRLVAKLITQSYQLGAAPGDPAVASNPRGLTYDPDFFAANPDLTGLSNKGGDLLEPLIPSDAVQELWQWINGDAEAKAFLDGTADPWGMVVNPSYRGATDSALPNSFLKSDPYCAPPIIDAAAGTSPPRCTLDVRSYANDVHDATRSASRGDNLDRSTWTNSTPPPHFTKAPLQISGQQSVMAFTDVATAARYSLPVARLRNAAGKFVAPTGAALDAALADVVPTSVAGVSAPNPQTSDPNAYPLMTVTYAATDPSQLSAQARSDYADFLKYAVTAGQVVGNDVGQLPVGYAPLSPDMVWQTISTATALRAYVSPSASPTPTSVSPTPTHKPTTKPSKRPTKSPPSKPSPTPPTTGPAPAQLTTSAPYQGNRDTAATSATGATPPPSASTAAPTRSQAVSSAPASAAPSSPVPTLTSTAPVAEIRRTPGVSVGGGRYTMVVVLALGGFAALTGPGLMTFARRRPR